MAGQYFDGLVSKAATTVAEVFERRGKHELASILRSATPWLDEVSVDPDNEQTHYSLNLDVPVDIYAGLGTQIADAEEAILDGISDVLRGYRHYVTDALVIGPRLEPPAAGIEPLPENAADHIWEAGMLRLFISHVAEHKAAVGELKAYLRIVGVSGFVAHKDIAPSLEWLGEIDLALRTAQACAALLTPEFHGSKWTDQEMGVAIARDIVVIPVDLGTTPYGFLGRYQALPGALDQTARLADGIVGILVARPQTVGAMREGLVTALEQANTYKSAKKVTNLLLSMPREFTEAQIDRIRAAVAANNQVGEAIGVPKQLKLITG